MKTTELFRKKIDSFFGKVPAAEKLFYKKVVYKDNFGDTGLTLEELKRVVPEILTYAGVRIIGIEIVNENDEFKAYNWEYFNDNFNSNWIIKAIDQIEEKNDNPLISIYVDFPKSKHQSIIRSLLGK